MVLDDRASLTVPRAPSYRDDANAAAPELARLRHRLHRHPEVGLDLPWTQRAILEELNGLGLEIRTGTSVTSITAVLRGRGEGRAAVLLRADMDGLPVQEDTGVEWASEVDGAMHACGHDLHMTMLVGAARLLAQRRAELQGDVVLMFQPGEEGADGAGHMLREGVLSAAGTKPSAAYGIHVFSNRVPRRSFSSRAGTLMAASDLLSVTVHGRGGHGSSPHTTLDPVSAAAQIVTAIHALITRRFDIFDPVVVTVGSIHGGTRWNIIPDQAHFDATVRSFSAVARERLRAELPRLCESIGEAFGVTVDAEWHDEYPLTINDATEEAFVADTVRDLFGDDRYSTLEQPEAGAEDFSRVLAEVPGCYVFLGASTSEDPATAPSNHSPRASFDDSVLPLGAELLAELATRALAREAETQR